LADVAASGGLMPELDMDQLNSLIKEGKAEIARKARTNSTSWRRGNIPPNARLTPMDAVEIRMLDKQGMPSAKIAAKYDICYVHVRNIVNRQAWVNAEKQLAAEHENLLKLRAKSPEGDRSPASAA
jgi:hypothetical protein